jgi:hypothetical protein
VQAEQDALHRSFQRREARGRAEELRRNGAATAEDCRMAVRLAFEAIGEEPAGGVAIQVRFPPDKSTSRRFPPDAPGHHVYAWIENQDFMWRNGGLIRFRLMGGVSELDPERTLEQQGIRGRTMLNAVEDSELE